MDELRNWWRSTVHVMAAGLPMELRNSRDERALSVTIILWSQVRIQPGPPYPSIDYDRLRGCAPEK